ncbi:MAG: dienelactone hydrolase family protein [Ferrovibrio sp.]|uniref:dienelactone hydrolase family protein n=1 Tax=Ferrovibrio sp. TaxID=1917215 RepID=UPI00262DC60C|nr:dienelactone hydrolase family protein [Ferrovibrio sp.]MCW0236628.1 dienelactone hydrolase family protein [Ferrovibrio sp.]
MGAMTSLTAADGHRLAAYTAEPKGTPKGGVVVIQEIFGVNGHIRAVTDGYAADGYYAVAPALFDRVQANVDLGYSAEDVAAGRDIRGRMAWDTVMKDVTVAFALASGAGRVGTVGYCYGGGVTWKMATSLPGLAASVGYYGGPWGELKDEAPKAPCLLHFGALDKMIPTALADEMKALHPSITTHVYDADHGFNCDQRATYNAAAAVTARRRTLAFFEALL